MARVELRDVEMTDGNKRAEFWRAKTEEVELVTGVRVCLGREVDLEIEQTGVRACPMPLMSAILPQAILPQVETVRCACAFAEGDLVCFQYFAPSSAGSSWSARGGQ